MPTAVAWVLQHSGQDAVAVCILLHLGNDSRSILAASATCRHLNDVVVESAALQLVLRSAYYRRLSPPSACNSSDGHARLIDVERRWAAIAPKRIDTLTFGVHFFPAYRVSDGLVAIGEASARVARLGTRMDGWTLYDFSNSRDKDGTMSKVRFRCSVDFLQFAISRPGNVLAALNVGEVVTTPVLDRDNAPDRGSTASSRHLNYCAPRLFNWRTGKEITIADGFGMDDWNEGRPSLIPVGNDSVLTCDDGYLVPKANDGDPDDSSSTQSCLGTAVVTFGGYPKGKDSLPTDRFEVFDVDALALEQYIARPSDCEEDEDEDEDAPENQKIIESVAAYDDAKRNGPWHLGPLYSLYGLHANEDATFVTINVFLRAVSHNRDLFYGRLAIKPGPITHRLPAGGGGGTSLASLEGLVDWRRSRSIPRWHRGASGSRVGDCVSGFRIVEVWQYYLVSQDENLATIRVTNYVPDIHLSPFGARVARVDDDSELSDLSEGSWHVIEWRQAARQEVDDPDAQWPFSATHVHRHSPPLTLPCQVCERDLLIHRRIAKTFADAEHLYLSTMGWCSDGKVQDVQLVILSF
ncbi:hypothetical protein Q8F55_008456 [Vanrija albida]|uniref:F-box domain-containing protein n=1 Tax=Vanrija albida TaxID=181172 RepID=A0ABR3PQW9_9TREE